MGIIKNLEKIHVAVVLDTFKGSPKKLGENLSNHAVDAMTNGLGSAQWSKYMSLFADNAEQLKRLTTESDDDPDYFRRSRAYMVANAVCGAGTTGQTGQGVDPTIGAAAVGAAQFDAVDQNFIDNERPFVVPEPN